MEDAIKSLKEFIWDIVGYLIPGFLLIIVINLVLDPSIGIARNFLFDWEKFGAYLIVVVSYILGYIIYSVTVLKIEIQDSLVTIFISFKNYVDHSFFCFLTKNKIVESLSNWIGTCNSKHWLTKEQGSSTFKNAKEFLKRNSYVDVDSMKFNEVRNIMMSRNPDMDQKVYTFMFRSSLFDHISTIGLITALLLIIDKLFGLSIIKKEPLFNLLPYIILPLLPLLGKCKRMFYSIAQRIPLSNLK